MSQAERTPLIQAGSSLVKHSVDHDDVYGRFTTSQKRIITLVISLGGIIGPFASSCFVPSVPEIARDLNTTGTIINYTVGMYILIIAVGNLVWAPYSAYYGRQPVYIVSFPMICIGSVGTALSQDVTQLTISRIIHALGASCVMSVGGATISDIYSLEERGTPMGILFGVRLLGPALSPLISGLVAMYFSWRVMQLALFVMGLSVFIAVIKLLPETCHPGSRGVDKIVTKEALVELEGAKGPLDEPQWKWVWLNPFKPLAILRGPVILLVSIATGFALMSYYVLLIPLAYTLGPKYGMSSPVLIGACCIPSAVGNMLGAIIVGRLADRAVIQGRKRRMGKWVPEDRIEAALPGVLIFLPLSLLVFGISITFVSGKWGLVICLACLFANGLGVVIVTAPTATYIVDILREQSAEAMATFVAFRHVFSAIGAAGVTPMLDKVGTFATNGLAALLAWVAFVLLYISIEYGDKLRAWVDIGYTRVVDAEET